MVVVVTDRYVIINAQNKQKVLTGRGTITAVVICSFLDSITQKGVQQEAETLIRDSRGEDDLVFQSSGSREGEREREGG